MSFFNGLFFLLTIGPGNQLSENALWFYFFLSFVALFIVITYEYVWNIQEKLFLSAFGKPLKLFILGVGGNMAALPLNVLAWVHDTKQLVFNIVITFLLVPIIVMMVDKIRPKMEE
jgi:hypothetical protein